MLINFSACPEKELDSRGGGPPSAATDVLQGHEVPQAHLERSGRKRHHEAVADPDARNPVSAQWS